MNRDVKLIWESYYNSAVTERLCQRVQKLNKVFLADEKSDPNFTDETYDPNKKYPYQRDPEIRFHRYESIAAIVGIAPELVQKIIEDPEFSYSETPKVDDDTRSTYTPSDSEDLADLAQKPSKTPIR